MSCFSIEFRCGVGLIGPGNFWWGCVCDHSNGVAVFTVARQEVVFDFVAVCTAKWICVEEYNREKCVQICYS